MARGYTSAGTQLYWKPVTATGAYTAIANAKEPQVAGAEKTRTAVTAISDTSDVFIGGKVTDGAITFKIYLDPADTNHQDLIAKAKTAGAVSDFQIKFPQVNANCALANVGGFLSGGAVTPVTDGALEVEFTYTPNGVWVATYA